LREKFYEQYAKRLVRLILGHTSVAPAPSTWGPNMTALQGWIVIGLLVLIVAGIVGLAAELQALPYLWRASAELIK
jgi:hypothetical protein